VVGRFAGAAPSQSRRRARALDTTTAPGPRGVRCRHWANLLQADCRQSPRTCHTPIPAVRPSPGRTAAQEVEHAHPGQGRLGRGSTAASPPKADPVHAIENPDTPMAFARVTVPLDGARLSTTRNASSRCRGRKGSPAPYQRPASLAKWVKSSGSVLGARGDALVVIRISGLPWPDLLDKTFTSDLSLSPRCGSFPRAQGLPIGAIL